MLGGQLQMKIECSWCELVNRILGPLSRDQVWRCACVGRGRCGISIGWWRDHIWVCGEGRRVEVAAKSLVAVEDDEQEGWSERCGDICVR
jgi:hypothetical protein